MILTMSFSDNTVYSVEFTQFVDDPAVTLMLKKPHGIIYTRTISFKANLIEHYAIYEEYTRRILAAMPDRVLAAQIIEELVGII